jgi:hypothetical protein
MTDIKPKPMDPERLAHLRGLSDPLCFTSAFQADIVAELLTDRDYHAQRAEHFTTISCVMASMAGSIQEIARAAGWPEDVPVEDPGELVESVAQLRAEAARLRARVRVEAEDVERAGVTRAHAIAWAGQHEGVCNLFNDSEAPWVIASRIQIAASFYNRPGLDILDEMAAMEVPA